LINIQIAFVESIHNSIKKGGTGMKGWQKGIVFVVVSAVIGYVAWVAAKFFGLIGEKEDLRS